MMRRLCPVLFCAMSLLVSSCEEVTPIPGAPTPVDATAPLPVAVGLEILGPESLNVGQTAVFQALTVRGDGSTVVASDVSWISSNEVVAVVRGTGLVTALQRGRFDLTAATYRFTAPRFSVRALGALQPWSASGRGPALVEVPSDVERVRVFAEHAASSSRAFVLWCGAPDARGGLMVDFRLGRGSSATQVTYDEEHSARRYYGASTQPCRHLDVSRAFDVRWRLTEVYPLGSR